MDLVALVGDALTSFEARLAEGFRVDAQLPASAQGKLIMADPDRLRQIFANLVENALRHAASGAGSAWKCAYTPDGPCWR